VSAPITPVTADTLALARSECEQAQHSLAAARSALEDARERFRNDPTADRDAEVERAAANLRSAERLVDAREFRLRSVTELLAAAEREHARQALERAGEVRDRIRAEIGERFGLLAEQFRIASQTIASLADLVQRDEAATRQANEAARQAGVSGQAVAISLPDLRRAFALFMSEGKRAPRVKVRQDDVRMRALGGLLAMLEREPITIDEQIEILNLAALEIATLTDGASDLGVWATSLYPPSANHRGSDADLEYARARRLLLALPIGRRDG